MKNILPTDEDFVSAQARYEEEKFLFEEDELIDLKNVDSETRVELFISDEAHYYLSRGAYNVL